MNNKYSGRGQTVLHVSDHAARARVPEMSSRRAGGKLREETSQLTDLPQCEYQIISHLHRVLMNPTVVSEVARDAGRRTRASQGNKAADGKVEEEERQGDEGDQVEVLGCRGVSPAA